MWELYIGLHPQYGMVLGLEGIWTKQVHYWTMPRSLWREDKKGPWPIWLHALTGIGQPGGVSAPRAGLPLSSCKHIQ